MTHAVPTEAVIEIALVLAPGLVDGREISLNFGAGGAQQRPNEAHLLVITSPHLRIDSCQTFAPCSAQELHQHRLGLIVECVSGGHGIESVLRGDLRQPFIAKLAAGRLQANSACGSRVRHVPAPHKKIQLILPRKVNYEMFVGI